MNEDRGLTHAVMLYDPATGVIRHTLLQTAATGGPAPDWAAMETRLRALVGPRDPATAGLAVLRSENHDPERFYAVDVQRRALVEVTSKV
jgi:hypothetical protein